MQIENGREREIIKMIDNDFLYSWDGYEEDRIDNEQIV